MTNFNCAGGESLKESHFVKIRLNLYAICINENEMEWNKFRENELVMMVNAWLEL